VAVFPDILADCLVVAFEAVLDVGLEAAFVASEAVPPCGPCGGICCI